jgi:hypothetical protein
MQPPTNPWGIVKLANQDFAFSPSSNRRRMAQFRWLGVISLQRNIELCAATLMIQIWAIYPSGGDCDLGASVVVQMGEVCDRLPVPVVRAALARGGLLMPEKALKPPDLQPGSQENMGGRNETVRLHASAGLCKPFMLLEIRLVHHGVELSRTHRFRQ